MTQQLAHHACYRLLVFGMLAAQLRIGTARGEEPSSVSADAVAACTAQLEIMNGEFRGSYAAARAALLASEGPILLLAGDEIILFHQGERTPVAYVPAQYHALKSISHVPLWAYVLLRDLTDRPLNSTQRGAVQSFRSTVAATRASLVVDAFPSGEFDRQRQILDSAVRFADKVLEQSTVSRSELTAYCRDSASDLWANVAAAARLELAALDAQVQRFREQLGPQNWAHVHVVIEGAHTPRAGNLAMQYFRRLLGANVDDNRLVYAENAFEEAKALNVLGTVRQDIGVGEAFFADPQRMLRDLLADATTDYLDERFGKETKSQPAVQSNEVFARPCRPTRRRCR